MIPLWMYVAVSAGLFSIGVFGVLARRNAVAILMAIELMLNAVNINLVAFWRYGDDIFKLEGYTFTSFVLIVAAAEAAVGLAIIISVYRNRRSVIPEEADTLKG